MNKKMNESPGQDIKSAYDTAAVAYSKKYADIPARTKEVDLVFSYCDKSEPVVLEIGYGNGREAKYILTKTSHYTGIDISESMQGIARRNVPGAKFLCADVHTYIPEQPIDIVFAFASLLHSDKTQLSAWLQKIHTHLTTRGLIFLSLKQRDDYDMATIQDEFSTRDFYYYNREQVLEMTTDQYIERYYDIQYLKEPWFTMVLQKK